MKFYILKKETKLWGWGGYKKITENGKVECRAKECHTQELAIEGGAFDMIHYQDIGCNLIFDDKIYL